MSAEKSVLHQITKFSNILKWKTVLILFQNISVFFGIFDQINVAMESIRAFPSQTFEWSCILLSI